MIKPTLDNILIKPTIINETVTKAGIVLANGNNETDNRPNMGIILEVGEKVQTLKKNDCVVFYKYSPTEIEIDNVKYYLLKEDEIMAIIKDDDN